MSLMNDLVYTILDESSYQGNGNSIFPYFSFQTILLIFVKTSVKFLPFHCIFLSVSLSLSLNYCAWVKSVQSPASFITTPPKVFWAELGESEESKW